MSSSPKSVVSVIAPTSDDQTVALVQGTESEAPAENARTEALPEGDTTLRISRAIEKAQPLFDRESVSAKSYLDFNVTLAAKIANVASTLDTSRSAATIERSKLQAALKLVDDAINAGDAARAEYRKLIGRVVDPAAFVADVKALRALGFGESEAIGKLADAPKWIPALPEGAYVLPQHTSTDARNTINGTIGTEWRHFVGAKLSAKGQEFYARCEPATSDGISRFYVVDKAHGYGVSRFTSEAAVNAHVKQYGVRPIKGWSIVPDDEMNPKAIAALAAFKASEAKITVKGADGSVSEE